MQGQTSSSSSQRENKASPPPEVEKPLTQNAHRRVTLWKAVSRVANCYWSTCSVRKSRMQSVECMPSYNSSLISTELADELGADGPEEKYFLTTCRGTKEIKCGRRVTDAAALSAERRQTCLLSSSAAMSLRKNERSRYRRWRGDSHTFRKSPMRSSPSLGSLTFISSLAETPQNLEFESLGTDLKEPPGHKSFL